MRIYKESELILRIIEKSKNILINVHRNPDLDSVGSATALDEVLKRMGKKVTLICPHKLDQKFLFLKNANLVKLIDYNSFDFSHYDCFLMLDTASWRVASDKRDLSFIKNIQLPIIVIDNHKNNSINEAKVTLIDENSNAVGEMIYYLLLQWNLTISNDIATALYSAIIGDTNWLQVTINLKSLYITLSQLLEYGADKEMLISSYYSINSIQSLQLIGEFLKNMKIYQKGNFVIAAIDYGTYVKYGKVPGIREEVADNYATKIKKTKYGVVLLEEEPEKIMLSFRSREVDVTNIAGMFNGGGHKYAAGATIYGEFRSTIEKIERLLSNYTFNK